jgi:signal transduction histidine kinase
VSRERIRPFAEEGRRGHRLRPRRMLAALRGRRSEIAIALILLGLIILPSGILGFLSWRAIQRERTFSEERLRQSYQHYARLAAREVDKELRDVEARWELVLEGVAGTNEGARAGALLDAAAADPMIASTFVIASPGHVTHPTLQGAPDSTRLRQLETGAEAHERAIFEQLVTRGEELEYHDRRLESAIASYREVSARVSSPQLRAIAESYAGRALIKNGDWADARATFERLLAEHPEERDLHRMYLRFLAQYQIAVAEEAMGRDAQSIETLLGLGRDLVARSDAIQSMQYDYYMELVQGLASRLTSSPHLKAASGYRQAFGALKEQGKKRVSQRYFLELLNAKLEETVIRRRHFSPRLRYLSDRAEGEPFLLVYRGLPDPAGVYVSGLVAAQIDLDRLTARLFPNILRNLQGDEIGLAIVNAENGAVLGADPASVEHAAVQPLTEPFDFWQVAVVPHDVPGALRRLDFTSTLWLWLVCLLLLAILYGAFLFIRRARRQAYLSRAQTTFVSNVSHELRTPLASIKMFAELLEMQMDGERATRESPGVAGQYLATIRSECDRLGRLIENVLDFSRMEHQTRRYRFEEHDLGEILRRTVESFRPHAEAHGFVLELRLEDDLPDVMVDADAIAQVLLNLLGNAVQYSDAVRHIDVSARLEDRAVAIDVADRGIGIAPDDLPHVFEKFFSGRRRMDSGQQSGLGLGLTLARSIAQAHGGDVLVRSVLGEGSTFTVTLPVAERSAADARSLAPAARVQRLIGGSR